MNNYDKITPTAWLVAYRRSFSDIPYAKEIFEELGGIKARSFNEVTDEMLAPKIAPQLEARYKIIDKYIKEVNSDQILEIAAGFSGRGLFMTQNPKITYVEFDLPKAINSKKIICQKIMGKNKIPDNLYFAEGNALDIDALSKAASYFKDKPITIVNEGLMRYLNFAEKASLANNIHKLLEQYGGIWITPDITLKKLLGAESDISKGHTQIISEMTGVDIERNRFETEEQARVFFENLGYTIERHSFMEVKDELLTPQRLNVSDDELNNLIGTAVLYIMRIRNQ